MFGLVWFAYGRQPEHGDGATTISTATPSEVKPVQPSEDSRPASDSDDMLWEEFLQGSDSASSASNESGDEGLYSHDHALPPPTVLSSDEDKAFSQVSAAAFDSYAQCTDKSHHIILYCLKGLAQELSSLSENLHCFLSTSFPGFKPVTLLKIV